MQQADKFDLKRSVKQFTKCSLNNSSKTFLGYTAVLIPAVNGKSSLGKGGFLKLHANISQSLLSFK